MGPSLSKAQAGAQPQVGPLIRARRRQLHLTLQVLADAAGISVGYVSQVERDLATPSLGTLAQIARSLDVGVDYFIATPDVENALSRAGERQSFSVNGSSIQYERIGTDFAGNVLSSFILSIPAGYQSETVSHEGEEIIYILEGELIVRVEPDEMLLARGGRLPFPRQPAAFLAQQHRPGGAAIVDRHGGAVPPAPPGRFLAAAAADGDSIPPPSRSRR